MATLYASILLLFLGMVSGKQMTQGDGLLRGDEEVNLALATFFNIGMLIFFCCLIEYGSCNHDIQIFDSSFYL